MAKLLAHGSQRETAERQHHQLRSEENRTGLREFVSDQVKPFIKRSVERLESQWSSERVSATRDAAEGRLRDLASRILDILCESVPGATLEPPPFRTQRQRHDLRKKQSAAFARANHELAADDRNPTPRAQFIYKDEWDREMYGKDAGMLLPGPKLAARELIKEALEKHVVYLLRKEGKLASSVVATASSDVEKAFPPGLVTSGEGAVASLPAIPSLVCPEVSLLDAILKKTESTLPKWAQKHHLSRSTVFRWRASGGFPISGELSTNKINEIREAILKDAGVLGLLGLAPASSAK